MTRKTESEESAGFQDTIKIALYGQFGSRKTQQIASLIDLVGAENVLIISAERGLSTVKSKLTTPENVIAVTNIDELRGAWARAKEFGTPAKFVVIDGMSQVLEWIANQQMSSAEAYYDLKARNLTIPDKLLPFGRFITDRGAVDSIRIYGRIGRESENLISSWIGLNTNLYFNFLEDKVGQSGYEKTLPYSVDVPGKVGLKAVFSSFDFIGRLFYDAEGRLVGGFDSQSRIYMARTREDRSLVTIPKEIVDFNLGDFIKLLSGQAASAPAM